MPIHYETDGDHVVLITIDRPEARNSCDMEHFKLLREAWERFAADDDAWVAIVTGVGEAFFSGADLKKYIPEITKFQKQIADEGLTEIDGYRLDDGTRAVLRNWPLYKPIDRGGERLLHRGRHGDARRHRHPGRLPGGEVRGHGAEARAVRGRRHDRAPAAPDPVAAGHGVPALRRPHPGRARATRWDCSTRSCRATSCSTRPASTPRASIANAPLAVQATKQSALQGLYADEDVTRAAARRGASSCATSSPTGADPDGGRRRSLDALRKELRTPFEKESRLSSQIFQTEDAKEGPKAFAEKRDPVWQAK